MKAFTKLIAVLFIITALDASVMPVAKRQQQARLDWTGRFNPARSWRAIHPRSQKKKRLIARRRRV